MDGIKEILMMSQYLKFKKQYFDKIVFFRMGDFFEIFGDDVKVIFKVLNIILIVRDKSSNFILLVGFFYKVLD